MPCAHLPPYARGPCPARRRLRGKRCESSGRRCYACATVFSTSNRAHARRQSAGLPTIFLLVIPAPAPPAATVGHDAGSDTRMQRYNLLELHRASSSHFASQVLPPPAGQLLRGWGCRWAPFPPSRRDRLSPTSPHQPARLRARSRLAGVAPDPLDSCMYAANAAVSSMELAGHVAAFRQGAADRRCAQGPADDGARASWP